MLDEADRMVNMEIYKILQIWPSTLSDAAFAPPGILLNVLSNLSRGHSEDRPGLDSSSTTYISRRGRGGRGLLLCFLPHVVTVRGECESGWDVLTLFEHVTPGEDPRPRLVFVENGPGVQIIWCNSRCHLHTSAALQLQLFVYDLPLLNQSEYTADTLSSNQNWVDHRKWNFNVIFTLAHL